MEIGVILSIFSGRLALFFRSNIIVTPIIADAKSLVTDETDNVILFCTGM